MAQIHRTLWFRFLLLTLLSSMAAAQLPDSDDSYVVSGSSTLQGTNPSMAVQGPTAGALIKPDISQLTGAGVTAGQVTRAYLKVYKTVVAVGGNIDVCEISSPWSEKTVVYTSKPSLGTALAINQNIATGTASQYLQLDITQAVKDWLTTPGSNNGVAIIPANSCVWGSSPSSISMTLDTKESTTSSHAPEVDVVLTMANGTVTSIAAGTGLGATPSNPITTSGTINLVPATGLSLGGVKAPTCASGHYSGIDPSTGILQCSADATTTSLAFSAVTTGTNSYQTLTVGNGSNLSATGTGQINATSAGHATSADSATNASHATSADSATNATHATNADSAVSALSAMTATSATTANHATSADTATNADNATNLGGQPASNYARLDLANIFAMGKKQTFQANSTFAGFNISSTPANPGTLASGDVWFSLTDHHLHFQDDQNHTLALAFTTDTLSGDGSGLTNLNASNLSSGTVPQGRLSGLYNVDINGNATHATSADSATNATHATSADTAANADNATHAVSADSATNAGHATTADSATNAGHATSADSAAFATMAATAATATNAGHADTADNATHATNSDQLGGVDATNYARRDTANTFALGQKQTVQSNDNYAGLNIAGFATNPTTNPLLAGDLWFNTTDNQLKFQDKNGATRSIAFTDSALSGNGSALTNLNASNLASGTVPTGRLSGSYDISVTHSTSADIATHATNADHATSADNATHADSATNADHATNADNAAHAVLADNATNAANAAHAALADTATLALSATNALHANLADNATHATSADSATDSTKLGGVDAANYARRDTANTFALGQKQTVQGNADFAGLNIAGFASDPANNPPLAGDLWFNNNSNQLKFQDNNGATRIIAFTDSALTGDGSGLTNLNASNLASGTVPATRLSGSYDISVTHASTADSATNATHANSADTATNADHATMADSATNANHATSADTATNAAHATAADLAAMATEAGHAATADLATNATHATNADHATSADSATDSAKLGGVDAANYARRDQANTFNGTQSLAPKGANSKPSNEFQLNANDSSSAPQTAQLQARADGALSFQFGPTSGLILEKASIDKNGIFTGNGSGLTNISGANVTNIPNTALQHSSVIINSGTGLTGGGTVALGDSLTLTNSGVLTFNGLNGAVTGVSTVSAGNGGILIGGTAENPTIANGGVLSFNGNTGNILAVFPTSTPAVTHQFFTSYNAATGAFTLAQPSFVDLSGTDSATTHLVYNNQANTYGAGNKQTFLASSTLAGLNLAGTPLDPTGTLAAGDLWYNNAGGTNHPRFFDGATTHSLMFRDDTIQNNQLQSSSITVSAGTGIGVSGSPVSLGGTVTISNSGVTSLTGTASQVVVSATTGSVTLSLPASINVNTTGSAGSFTGNLAGDVTGGQSTTAVSKLQGTTLAVSGLNAPASGQVLAFSGTQWQPASITGAGFGAQSANTVLSGPTIGAAANPTFRGLVSADLPVATSGQFGAVKPTIANNTTTPVNQTNNTVVNYSVSCAPGRFVLGGGYTVSDVKLMPTASFPAAADTWRITLTANGSVSGATVTVYAICSGN